MTDARFQDSDGTPLRLRAESPEDLTVLSSLTQDAVFPVSQVTWQPAQRRFGVLLYRFRWEDIDAAQKARRPYERVHSVLQIDDALSLRSRGVDRGDPQGVLSLLSIKFERDKDCAGVMELILAGGASLELGVEAINATLQDVTRPYAAPSGLQPKHT